MRLDEKQLEAVAKSLITIGTYALTAVPFGLFVAPKATVWWAYVLVFCFGVLFLIAGIYLSKKPKDEPQDNITAEIKKGIFHINNATINKEEKDND